MKKSPIRVIVEPAPLRKGYHWRQVASNGSTGAVSPKYYDTKSAATRAGRRQVELLNGQLDFLLPGEFIHDRLTPDELEVFYGHYATLEVLAT